MMPFNFINDWSINYKDMLVSLISPRPSFLKLDNGIKVMVAPKSYIALLNCELPRL